LKKVTIPEKDIDTIISCTSIDVSKTRLVKIPGTSADTRVYKVDIDLPVGEAYIIDTPAGARLASMPEIVGLELEKTALEAAEEAAKFFEYMREGEENVLLLHVLRASTGYMLNVAMEKRMKTENIYVRVRYDESSYRDHEGREARAIYTKVGKLVGDSYIIVVADTVATGNSVIEALGRTIKVLNFKNVKLKEAYFYGFMSLEGIKNISSFLSEQNLSRVIFLTIQDITPLSSNKYDMPLYGIDEFAYSEKKEKRILGSIVDRATLKRMLPLYYPGMDQPGDWSERQCKLFNGFFYERGDIEGHLKRSLEMLEKLREIQKGEEWYREWHEQIYNERKEGIKNILSIKKYC